VPSLSARESCDGQVLQWLWRPTGTPVPPISATKFTSPDRASDPWVSVRPDGTAYAVSISFSQSNNSNAVAAVVSRNGGQTWSDLSVIIADDEPTL
jgi:hypothetical protein